jgi:hypothetical protein
MASWSAKQRVTWWEPQLWEIRQMLIVCVFPEQQDQLNSVFPRRLYVVGWDARQNLEWVKVLYSCTSGTDRPACTLHLSVSGSSDLVLHLSRCVVHISGTRQTNLLMCLTLSVDAHLQGSTQWRITECFPNSVHMAYALMLLSYCLYCSRQLLLSLHYSLLHLDYLGITLFIKLSLSVCPKPYLHL